MALTLTLRMITAGRHYITQWIRETGQTMHGGSSCAARPLTARTGSTNTAPSAPRNMNFHILTDDLRLALWRRLKLYSFGKPSKYTTSAQHRVAADPFLSHHLGTFLILHPADSPLSTSEKIALHRAIRETMDLLGEPYSDYVPMVSRRAEEILGVPKGSLDDKEYDIYSFWFEATGT